MPKESFLPDDKEEPIKAQALAHAYAHEKLGPEPRQRAREADQDFIQRYH